MDQAKLQRAYTMCASMNNRELLVEFAKGRGGVIPEAWAALEAQMKKRSLRLKPWDDQSYVLLTTADHVGGFRVTRTLEIVTAECAFGMNVLSDFFASMSDFFGGRSGATQNILRDARKTCLAELRKEAATIGADAVIGVDLDYSEFSGQGKSMLFLVASGTAVHLEPGSPGRPPNEEEILSAR